MLREQGQEAWALRGGVASWIRAGLPTETRALEAQHAAAQVCPECGQPLGQHIS
jgi:hypothetical protein